MGTNLISTDEFVGECQTRHKTAFLQPEDGSERTTEEDAFNRSESDDTLTIRSATADPSQRPIGFPLYTLQVLDSVEKKLSKNGRNNSRFTP